MRLSLPATLRLSISKDQCISDKRKSARWYRCPPCDRMQPIATFHLSQSHAVQPSSLCFLAPADAVCRSSDLSSSSSSSSSHDGVDEHHSSNSSSSTLLYSSRNVRTVNFQRSQIPVTEFTHNLLRCTQRPLNLLNSPLYLVRYNYTQMCCNSS